MPNLAMTHFTDDLGRDHTGVCFRPGDDPDDAGRGNGGRCHHASDGTSTKCFHAAAVAGPDRSVSSCHPPSDAEPPVNSCRCGTDDLAADLHLTLTGVEERHLAVLSGRRS